MLFRTRLPALASALALVSSCGDKPPAPALPRPPADLLARADKPAIPPAALESEAAYEAWREDVNDWGEANAGIIDRACWWLADNGVEIGCRERPASPSPE